MVSKTGTIGELKTVAGEAIKRYRKHGGIDIFASLGGETHTTTLESIPT